MQDMEILEQPAAQGALDEQERHYAQAGKALRELSHAIKNIIQMVSGAAEVIDYAMQIKQMDKLEKSWPILNLNIKRMKKYLLDVFDYTKKQSPVKCSCDLNEEVKRVAGSLKWIASYKKFKLQVQLDSGLPQVEIDPERAGLLTLNMLLNAIDQSEDGGTVGLATKYYPQDNAFEVRVTDNGAAYSEEFQKQLFTPHETHKQRFSTGIGIMLAEQIASQHGGELRVQCVNGANTLLAVFPVKG